MNQVVSEFSYIPNVQEGRIGDWIQVFSGKIFHPLDPRPEEVYIEDIAHSLSLKCRYGGHSKRFYSVAEHAWIISLLVPEEFALWGLLHDAGEAYSSDIPRPLKRCLPDWKIMENRIMDAICTRFGLPLEEPDIIKQVDLAITSDERAVLMNPCEREWGALPPALGVEIKCMTPKQAERAFLKRFKQLTTIRKVA